MDPRIDQMVLEADRLNDLLTSDAAWQLTFDAVPDPIAVLDTERRIVHANRALAERVGCAATDLVGERCYRRVHGADEPPKACPVARLLAGGDHALAEIHEEILGGDFMVTVSPLRDAAGTLIGSVHVMREVSERIALERDLRGADNLLTRFADAHDDLVFIKDAEGRYLLVNEANAAFFGRSKREIVGRVDGDLMPADAAARCRLTDLEAMRNGGVSLAEEEVDGHVYETRKFAVDLGDGGIAVGGLVRDVTGRRRAEKDLTTSEDRFRTLFENSLNAIALHEMVLATDGTPADYVFVTANPAFAAMTGLEVQDVIGRRATEVIPGLRETGLIERYGRIAATGEPERFQVFVPALGRHYDVAAFSPAPGAFATAFGDITEQKVASDLLAESEEKFRLAMEAARLGIYDWHVPSGGVYFSPGYAAMLGYRREKLAPTYGEWERRVHDEDRDRVLGTLQEFLSGDVNRFESEYRLQANDGHWIWALEQARVVELDGDGSPLRVVGTISDISTRRRAQDDLRATTERLRRTVAGTVTALGAAVESKDPYTAGHERRVAELACAIAEDLGRPEEEIAGLQLAAVMHDVGKIAVPAEILSKPGMLTDIEMTLVRRHAEVGRDIIAGIEFDRPVADIVWQHHERLDGSGYPRELTGDLILPEARVLAVADVVEAMMSHRPYRPARPITEAMDEIAAGAGVLYDRDVCAVCRSLFLDRRFAFSE
jgi:PAS domain S-box-containing protein